MFHAPMIAGSPDASLAAVWARRPAAAAELAGEYAASVAANFEDLLEICDAVAFAVPPDVQSELAPRAAAAGKHLLLEKPLAFTLEGAERIATAVEDAGVVSMLMIRNRFDPLVMELLKRAEGTRPRGLMASLITDAALPGSVFATPWRIERGALLDVGPHVLDLVEVLLGPVTGLTAAGNPLRWVAITTSHQSGAVAQVSLSITTPEADNQLRIEVVTETGRITLAEAGQGDVDDSDETVRQRIMAEFTAGIAAGRDTALGARRGLELQRLLSAAENSIRGQDA
jgi:predicted dehydrogenase